MFDVGGDVRIPVYARVGGEQVELVHVFREPTGEDMVEFSRMVVVFTREFKSEVTGGAERELTKDEAVAVGTLTQTKASIAFWDRVAIGAEGYGFRGSELVVDPEGVWKRRIPARHKQLAVQLLLSATDHQIKKL